MVTAPSPRVTNSPEKAEKKQRAIISAALVYIASIASRPFDDFNTDEAKATPLLRRFRLQSVARDILPDFRVSKCLHALIPQAKEVEILRSEKTGAAKYSNLQVCGSVWVCPVCAARISERRRSDLQQAVATWRLRGGKVIFVTYTLAHRLSEPLEEVLGSLTSAKRFLKAGRGWGTISDEYRIIGTISAKEITLGFNGWHPHIHELIFTEGSPSPKVLESELRQRWLNSLARYGGTALPSIGLQMEFADQKISDYITKLEHEPRVRWSSAHEMAKSQSKRARGQALTPLGLLEASEEVFTDGFYQEYALATKGKNQMVWSGGLAERLNMSIQADEDIVGDNQPEYLPLAALSRQAWRQVLQEPPVVRGKILEVARGGYEPLRDYLLKLQINISSLESGVKEPLATSSNWLQFDPQIDFNPSSPNMKG